MSDVECRTVERWVQAPDELDPLEARRLDRHLDTCADCASYQAQRIEIDGLIEVYLTQAVGGISVRDTVLAQLSAAPTQQPEMSGSAPRAISRPAGQPLSWLRRRWKQRIPRIAVTSLPVAAALGIVLAFLSPAGRLGNGPQPVGAWPHLEISIGYPMTVDPHHPNHLLAGAWGQVYQSWNAGGSWKELAPLPPGLVVRDLAIDTMDSRRYVVATRHSVLLSTDAGHHWTVTASNLLGAENMFVMQHPGAPGTFYLGPSILWASRDHAATWTPAGLGTVFAPYGIQSLAFGRNGTLYTGIWGGGVAISRDGGSTWLHRSRGLPRNVLSVTVGPTGRLWAATDRGVYRSVDGGRSWARSGPATALFATAVIDRGSYQLLGGSHPLTNGLIGSDNRIYRSEDGGRHWDPVSEGLPVAPYAYGFIPDPSHVNLVYASLDVDGIFRSDDAGRHWQAINAGLPITTQEGAPDLVLFRRNGALWISNAAGADPTVLTVDETVQSAALSPDGTTAAYTTGTESGWALRVVSPGAASHTILSGDRAIPRHLFWSPDSTRIAVPSNGAVSISSVSSPEVHWSLSAREHLLGWTADARGVLVWNSGSGVVSLRDAHTGTAITHGSARYPVLPRLAPDSHHLAYISGGLLTISTWRRSEPLSRTSAPARCLLGPWSSDSNRVLLACPRGAQIRDPAGHMLIQAQAPRNARWVPGSNTDLVFFQDGSLWRWEPGHFAWQIVHRADDVQPR